MQPRASYIRELAEVQCALRQLADAVDHMLARALRAFRDSDTGAAHDTVCEDDEIDDRRYALEEHVLRLIAAQQPLASDLRFLLAALQVATELERVGDYANGMATLVIRNADAPPIRAPRDVFDLAEIALDMLHRSVAAFLARDPHAASDFEIDDDRADVLFAEILIHMQQVLSTEPDHIRRLIEIVFVAHNLERIADRAVNIAERATFVATGNVVSTHNQRATNAA